MMMMMVMVEREKGTGQVWGGDIITIKSLLLNNNICIKIKYLLWHVSYNKIDIKTNEERTVNPNLFTFA